MSDQATDADLWHRYVSAIGTELHRRRVDAGLTQESLAQLAGMTRNYYRLIETGGTVDRPANPSLRALVRLANALGADVSKLLKQT